MTGGDVLPFLAVFAVPCVAVLAAMPAYAGLLRSRGRLADDAHKMEGPKVPTPAGPLLFVSIVGGELIVYAFYHSLAALTLVAVCAIAFAIGMFDDFRGLGGVTKPALLLAAGLPLVVGEYFYSGLYSPTLYFPIFTSTGTHYIIFGIIVLAALPVVSNAFNMLDSFNGEISGFALIVSVALIAGTLMRSYVLHDYSVDRVAVGLPLAAVALGFYVYNRYPSRVFDGDSGSLVLGSLYAGAAVVGGVEIAALVALIPAVLNSYFILTSVRGLIERKKIKTRPTHVGSDGKIYASREANAPTTLVRMVLLGGPLREDALVKNILVITAFAAMLSILTSVMTWFL